MLRYLVKRLLVAGVTLWGISLVTFVFINLAPGDPVRYQTGNVMGGEVSPGAYRELQEYYGLDQPILVRYVRWVGRLVRLDFGDSMAGDGRPVMDKIAERIWPTMSVALLAMVLGLAVSIPVGIYAAVRRDGWFDVVSGGLLYALYSVPGYVMAVPLILIVGVKWDLLPFQGMVSDNYEQLSGPGQWVDVFRHYVLITFCFGYGAMAYYCRFVRQNMLEVLGEDYVRTARAKGLSEFGVVVRHAFGNTLIPLMTLMGMLLPSVIGGSIILEVMFNWPGMGRLFFESMLARDYPTIMALSFITAVLVLVGNLLADLSYAAVDPRVRYD